MLLILRYTWGWVAVAQLDLGPGVSRFASMDITDCHYVSDFVRDEVVPDQTPVLVR